MRWQAFVKVDTWLRPRSDLCGVGDIPEIVVKVGLSRALHCFEAATKAIPLCGDDLAVLDSQEDNGSHDRQAK